MAIGGILEMVLSILVAVMPTILAVLKERSNVKKSAFDLGVSELHVADERMRVEGDQHQPSPVQPR